MYPMFFPVGIREIKVPLTVTAATPYADGFNADVSKVVVNAALLKGGPCGLRKVVVTDASNQNAKLTLCFFSKVLATVLTDNTIFNPSAADMVNMIGKTDVNLSDYISFTTFSTATTTPNLMMKANNSTIYLVVVTRDAPTYAAATDLKLTLSFDQY